MKINIETSGDGQKRDLLHNCEIYIAIVTPNFMTNLNCIGEMKDAQALKKNMFALLDKKTKVTQEFWDCNWTLILKYGNIFEYKKNCEY